MQMVNCKKKKQQDFPFTTSKHINEKRGGQTAVSATKASLVTLDVSTFNQLKVIYF